MRLIRTIGLAALASAAFLFGAPAEAEAGDRHWRHGGHPGRGWGPPPGRHMHAAPFPRHYHYAPRPRYHYVPPPRVYYAPPPIFYVPPPRYYYAPPPFFYGPPPGVSLHFRF